ncbi:progestin and adipoQ receptor family member 3 isoform X1 [Diachasma alloeum]|uniref:progestin and adipoQ receptor family member 3 isoform X1 n=2 Tax=Diachasma alloeum TaxID=454923 RepID=UPI000738197C|nr:progestin and adipoQ receptor family member 3 isoform X1 [Diachasma alloeum]
MMTRKIGIASRLKDQLRSSNIHNVKNSRKNSDEVLIYDNASEEEKEMRRILTIKEAPEFLTHNPYILNGYRGCKTKKLCVESAFWWTNETINIWSHVLGFLFFFGLTCHDLYFVDASYTDKAIALFSSINFQIALISSTIYHTFSCRNDKIYNCLLTVDMLGISLSLLAIYLTGIHFSFTCYENHRFFYLITVLLIFIIAIVLQIPQYNFSSNVKTSVLFGWAAYGILPTIHGVIIMGGLQHPMVQQLFPRIVGMYAITSFAFFLFETKIPERFFPGSVDYIGSSHQWWHLLILFAFFYWRNTGLLYIQYINSHGCIVLS